MHIFGPSILLVFFTISVGSNPTTKKKHFFIYVSSLNKRAGLVVHATFCLQIFDPKTPSIMKVKSDFGVIFVIPIPYLRTPVY